MNNKYSVEIGVDPQRDIQLLEDRLYEHNSAQIGRDDGRIFSRIVRDEDSNIVAGIAGWTWAGICEITQLWVDEGTRKNGLGQLLLEIAELEAQSHSCYMILVRSYSFQAPHFYEKYGYKTEHIINDFPRGCGYYIMTKRIG